MRPSLAVSIARGGESMRKYTKPAAKKVGFGGVLAPLA
jgi:hypothetical protein